MSATLTAAPELRWEDPPPPRRSGPRPEAMDWPTIASKLRARPNVWAIVRIEEDRSAAARTAHRINSGRIQSLYPLGAYKAESRTVGNEYRVYAHYIGGEAR